MNPSYSYGGFAADTADRTRTLFGQVMWYVAATAGVFALGSYLGRDLGRGVAIIAYIAAFACLIAGFGAAGYATRRDLSGLRRVCFWALLRRSRNMDSAPLIAASIFLDALNVFLFFVRIFSRGN